MIMRRTVITVVAVCFAVFSVATSEPEPSQQLKSVETTEINAQEPSDTRINSDITAVAAQLVQEYVTPTLCSYSPDFCDKHQLQTSRGIQSYLATAGTMFAGVLGVILMKIKILMVLSLMTTIIGKLLLFYAFFHSGHHPHHGHKHYLHGHHSPLVKYTRDKYYIKNTPVEHSHDVIVDHPTHHSPYHPPDVLHHRQAESTSSGVSYYKR